MSEETPRLSRREMRERGLLKPVTTGTSPIEELSQTQELNLRRLSRKELRERSTASNEAVAAELAAAASSASPVTPDEPVIAPGQAEPKIGSARESVVSPGSSDNGARRSVFDRFSSAQGSADDSHDATAGSQKRELHAGADDASVDFDSESDESLEDRLLARVRQDTAAIGRSGNSPDEPAHDESPTGDSSWARTTVEPSSVAALGDFISSPSKQKAPVLPAGPESSADKHVAFPEVSANLDDSAEDEAESTGGQHGVLMTVVFVLVGLLLGVLVGLAIRHFFMSGAVPLGVDIDSVRAAAALIPTHI